MGKSDMQFEDVDSGGWAKLTQAGETVEGIFQSWFIKPAQGQFGEQIVAVLDNDGSITNIWFPSKNAKYSNGVRALKVGHRVRVTLAWFYNQDSETIVPEAGKTKKGTSFAKSYTIQQSTNVDPSYVAMKDVVQVSKDQIDIEDLPF